MEAKIFRLIVTLYSLTTFFGLCMLFMTNEEIIEKFKKWVLDKVYNNYTLYVVVLSTLFMIYGVAFAWIAGCLLLIYLVIYLVVLLIVILKGLIHKIYKTPQSENTNNIEIDVIEEV